ncbi:MAG TPA: RNA polymerase sigma factor [Thermohalobaculum sp.]|nr:RNA polymerase sigma factor [Thermohalobaculum sp.]
MNLSGNKYFFSKEFYPETVFFRRNFVSAVLSIQIVVEVLGKVRRVEPQIEKEMIALLPRLRRFALSLTRSGPAADDLAQAAIERAIVNLDKWEPGTRLDSWMYRIAHNLHLNEARSQKTRGEKHGIIQMDSERSVDGERAVIARLEFSAVSAAIALLPGDQRQALLLVAVEGRSYQEAAEITGASVAAVTSRIARAREALRGVVERSD